MALVKIDYPENLTDQDDFSAHGDLIEARYFDQVNSPILFRDGFIPQGAILQVGGVVYNAEENTNITGTTSLYVRITADGETATAAYVSNIAGVSWVPQFNGYYDTDQRLYIFDEGKALFDGAIQQVFGRYLMQQPTGDVAIGRDLAVKRNISGGGTLGVTGNTTVGGTLGVTGNISGGGNITIPGTINTGQGATNVHLMNQNVRTTDAVTFSTVNTGQGNNNLHPMDQAVQTTDTVQFGNIGIGKTPTTTLDVAGGIEASANISVGGNVNAIGNIGTATGVGAFGILTDGANPTANPPLAAGGRAAGYYTGSTRDETNLPVGSIISVYTESDFIDRNATATIRILDLEPFINAAYTTTGSGAVLSGTWRARGYAGFAASSTHRYHLFQRVS